VVVLKLRTVPIGTALSFGQTTLSSPLSSEFGTHKTVKARFWPWLEPFLGDIILNLLNFYFSLGSGPARWRTRNAADF